MRLRDYRALKAVPFFCFAYFCRRRPSFVYMFWYAGVYLLDMGVLALPSPPLGAASDKVRVVGWQIQKSKQDAFYHYTLQE